MLTICYGAGTLAIEKMVERAGTLAIEKMVERSGDTRNRKDGTRLKVEMRGRSR